MKQWDSFNPVTRRALSINYISPMICMLGSDQSGSGSGAGVLAALDILPVNRLRGPEFLSAVVNGAEITLTWGSKSYAFSYTVYLSSTSPDGPFVLQTANLLSTSFVLTLTPGTYYGKVTLVEPDFGESFPSPTIQIVVP